MKKIRKSHKRRERGQSLVEFALLAPILLILFMGMFDFGWILHKQIQMDNATREASRRGAVGETNAQMTGRILDMITFDLTLEQITIDVLDPYGVSVGDNTNRIPDNLMHVAIDMNDVQLITPLQGFVGYLGPINLHSETEFLIE